MLTLEQIRAAFTSIAHDVPELGIVAHVHALSAEARDALFDEHTDAAGKIQRGFAHAMVAAAVRDAEGAAHFTAETARALPHFIFDRLHALVMRANGLAPAAVEDAEKNSGAAQSGDSPSASLSAGDAPSASS